MSKKEYMGKSASGKNVYIGKFSDAEDSEPEFALTVLPLASDPSDFVFHSGSTVHMCWDKKMFDGPIELSKGKIRVMITNSVYQVEGIGTIRLKLADGTFGIMKEVRYVPTLKSNLISVGTMTSKGDYEIVFGGGIVEVSRGERLILKGAVKDGLFCLERGSVAITARDIEF